MADGANMIIVVKNTFLHVQPLREDTVRFRSRSTPLVVGRGCPDYASTELDGDRPQDEDSFGQLARLGAILRGSGEPKVEHDASKAAPVDDRPCSSESPAVGPRAPRRPSGRPNADAATRRGEAAPSAAARPSVVASCSATERTQLTQAARVRPCKGKRERLHKAMVAIERTISADPDVFSRGSLKLPAFFDQNPAARGRIMARLAVVAAEAYRSMDRSTAAVAAPR
mmetsp:Transcript_727/g.1821  ORF Transcript_727/g.1821 Transcript_727/m.1821 type:complete len:227 (-) Transcript_727:387-1067(-)